MRYGRHGGRSSGIGGIDGGRVWMSSLSLGRSHGIPQTAAVGRPARVQSGGARRTAAGTGEVYRRREDDAARARARARTRARARVLPAVVDGTVRIGAWCGGSHGGRGGRGGDVRRAPSGASAVLTAVVDAAASVLTIVANAAASGVWTVVSGVLAVAVPVAAAVTGRVLLEPFVDFSRFARIAVPPENHAGA